MAIGPPFSLFFFSILMPNSSSSSSNFSSLLKKTMSESQSVPQSEQDPSFIIFDDALFCEEEHLEEEELKQDCSFFDETDEIHGLRLHTQKLNEQDLYWESDELSNLLSKEVGNQIYSIVKANPNLGLARADAVDWMLKVHGHYSFSVITAGLAVNYLDRFLFSFEFQREKPWMTQLAAVACLSLAAKVEETHVPLLLDFQIEDSKYVFEAKTIQRMEILVLSTLQWKMNPVTPHSFLDYLIRRLGLKDYLCWEFLRRCERILLFTVSDPRFMCYLPSTMAVATILHVINSLQPCIGDEYQTQLLEILGIHKEKVEECCQLILELAASGNFFHSNKRKSVSMPGSPNGVIDVSFSSDSSNDSWAATSSVSSSPEPLAKRIRTTEDQHLERFNHPSVDFLC